MRFILLFFCTFVLVGCGKQEQFYGCADIAIGVADVEVAISNKTVVIPDGDVDERKEVETANEYDHTGACACKCDLTSVADNMAASPTVYLFVYFLLRQLLCMLNIFIN